MKKKKGFTLVELLAVIAILAIILLIAVPQILGVIEDAKQDSFRNSVRGVFKAAELANAKDGITSGNIEDLPLGGQAMGGKWKLENELITLTEVTNGDYCVNSLEDNKKGDMFTLSKDCSEPPLPPVVYKETALNGSIPELYEGLIPVLHDGTKWIVSDINTEWYKYADKKWANAVTVTSSSRDKYKVAGTEVLEADVLTYLVWIPRYKYKLWNAQNGSSNPQTIEIIFENKDTPKSSGGSTDGGLTGINGEYLTHPAFTFGTTELNGIWVGKFENSTSDTTCNTTPNATNCNKELPILVKPGLFSWRFANNATFFKTIRNMENSGNQYGLNGSLVDTHMMKNMEWGAVVYLSYSNYGINDKVRINNSSNYLTGCASTKDPSEAGYAPYDGCENAYNTTAGIKASTTGNITGIYDTNGGGNDHMMSFIYGDESKTSVVVSSTGFTTAEAMSLVKYADIYNYGTTYNDAAAHARGKLGDATKEILVDFNGTSPQSWHLGHSYVVYSQASVFGRGGVNTTGINGSQFAFYSGIGGGGITAVSRLVIARD